MSFVFLHAFYEYTHVVQFSDGSIGETAFSSCRRDSHPHIAYLNGQDVESNEFNNDFHYVNGLIRDLSNGNSYVIQPKNWAGYVEQIRNRTERRRLIGQEMQKSFAARTSTVSKRRDLESNVADAIGSNDDNEDFLGDHFIYSMEDFEQLTELHGCGNSVDPHHINEIEDTNEDEDGHRHRHRHLSDDVMSMRKAMMRKAAIKLREEPNKHRQLQADVRYLELMVSNDYARVMDEGSTGAADGTLDLVNKAALYYGTNGVSAGFNVESMYMH